MRLAGQKNRSPGRPGHGVMLNNEKTGVVAVAFNPPAMVSRNVDAGVTPLVGDIGSILSEVVFPIVVEGAPLADHVDKVFIDSGGVSPLAMTGGLSSGIAGVAGSTRQSGTITSIDSLVGPANTNVPNTAKSAVPGKRLFADSGSNAISASSWPKAFILTPSPSASSVYDPVYLFTGGVCC